MDNIIEVKNVSMRFNLEKDKTDTIKEYLLKPSSRHFPWCWAFWCICW